MQLSEIDRTVDRKLVSPSPFLVPFDPPVLFLGLVGTHLLRQYFSPPILLVLRSTPMAKKHAAHASHCHHGLLHLHLLALFLFFFECVPYTRTKMCVCALGLGLYLSLVRNEAKVS